MPLTYKPITLETINEEIKELKERIREVREDMRIIGDFVKLLLEDFQKETKEQNK